MSELMKSGGWNPLWLLANLYTNADFLCFVLCDMNRRDSHIFVLWVNLGHADPYHILPIIAALTTFIQMKVFQSNITAGEQVQMQNYDAGNDFIYGICGTIGSCVVLDNR